MTVHTLNNVGITNNWDLGSSGWKPAMDTNLLLLDGLVQPNVATRATTAPPGSPAAGDRYLVPHTGSSGAWASAADQYAVWSGSAWVFATPLPGWSVYVADEHKWYMWDGSLWTVLAMQEAGISCSTATIASGILTLDASLGGAFDVSLISNITTLTLLNPVASPDVTRILVRFSQDATGSRTIALPGNVKCLSGTTYVPTGAAHSVDLVHFTTFDAGTTWYLESSQAASGGGGGGGGSLTVVDYLGTNVTGVTNLTLLGTTVTGVTPNATATVAGFGYSDVAGLPSSPNIGDRGFVYDASNNTFLAPVANGGSFFVPVVFDGSSWLIG